MNSLSKPEDFLRSQFEKLQKECKKERILKLIIKEKLFL